MKVRTHGWIALVTLAALAANAPARGEVSVRIDISNAPPPPRIVFREPPREVMVRQDDEDVYVVQDRALDYDLFHYEAYWYVFGRDGYWYRAFSWRGPFVVIRPALVPAVIYRVPARHWRHHPHGGPPGLMKKRSVIVVKEKRGHGHEREHHH